MTNTMEIIGASYDAGARAVEDEAPLLELLDVEAVYDGIVIALRGVSLRVPDRGVVALLGANGAGKSTTLKAISGVLRADHGEVSGGTICYLGQTVVDAREPGAQGRDRKVTAAHDLVKAGLVQVLEGRRCFPHFTVDENLRAGALIRRTRGRSLRGDLDRIYAYFPRLARLRTSIAGFTSGGEQQMLAIGRALMTRPRLVLLDEASMGLAPLVTAEIFEIVRTLNRDEGVSFLIAEQNARLALAHADYGYILENGRVAAGGTAAELRARSDVQEFYLGVGARRARTARVPAAGTHQSIV
jgi:branched-chain amino acid transport system ATP-binding protein